MNVSDGEFMICINNHSFSESDIGAVKKDQESECQSKGNVHRDDS